MTTKYMETTGIPLYRVNGDTFCKMIDVVKLIHHEFFETDNKEVKDILDRMEMRLTKNDFLLASAKKPQILQKKEFPKRYAVGFYDKEGKWHFYVDTIEGQTIYSTKPCKAKLYETYRSASAVADFVDEDASVLDWEANMSEEDRWQRELNMPFPYDADDGNEESIPVEIVT